MKPVLEISKLVFRISGMQILNGVNLTVNEGETVGLIGPNGSGKTTLFNCISGFNFPQEGQVLLKGHDITRQAPHLRARHGLGRVFQNSGVFREMTLLENVLAAIEGRQSALPSFFPWMKQSRINARKARDILSEIHLAGRENEKASSLSGGQMRLLEIMRTLAFGADVFLLDEPTAGVSPRMKDDVAALIRKLHAMGKTTIVIEHDITFIQKFCDRIVVLDEGEVVMDDTPTRVRENPILKEIYFGSSEQQMTP